MSHLKTTIGNIKKILEIQNTNTERKDYSSISFLSPIHYNLIASFHKKHPSIKLENKWKSPTIKNFMERVGLLSELGLLNFLSYLKGNSKKLIEITNINNGKKVDEVSSKFINELSTKFCKDNNEFQENEILDNVKYCLTEMFNNILDHSTDYTTNYSSGHYFQDQKYIQFAIVDCGIGIKEDISKTNENITSHRQAIETALQKGKSGKLRNGASISTSPYSTKENAGIGLTAVNNIIIKNSGDFVIGSGNYMYVFDSEQKNAYYTRIPNWNGTFIFFNMYPSKMNIYDYATVLSNLMKEDCDDLISQIKFF